MNEHMYAEMAEATRLTREGKLAEATALIQRNLGRAQAPAATPPHGASAAGMIAAALRDHSASSPRPAIPAAPALPGIVSGRPRRRSVRRPVPAEAVVPAGGRWVTGTHGNAAGTLGYKLYVPKQYNGSAVPLIVMLHGCTQDPDDFAAGTGMNTLAETDGFIVVYPAQAATANANKCWNWFQTGDQVRDRGEPALIAGITRQVMAEYRIDASRVYVAGLSAGGAMAAIMASAYPDLYAAAGVHSGLAPGSAHDLPSAFKAMKGAGKVRSAGARGAIPLIVFQGDSDQTVHPDNAVQLVRHWSGDGPASDGRTTPNVTVRRGRAAGGRDYTCAIYHDASGQTVVEEWTVHGAGHAWSGGGPSGSFTDPGGPDASRELVRFFREQPRGRTASPHPPRMDQS